MTSSTNAGLSDGFGRRARIAPARLRSTRTSVSSRLSWLRIVVCMRLKVLSMREQGVSRPFSKVQCENARAEQDTSAKIAFSGRRQWSRHFAWFLHHPSRGPAKRSLHPETRPEIRAKEFPAQNTVSRSLHFLKLRTPRRHCPGQDQDGNRGRLDRAGPSRLLGLVRSSCSKYLTPVWWLSFSSSRMSSRSSRSSRS